MKRLVFVTVLMLACVPVYAAEIAETYSHSGSSGEILWEQINNDDTTSEAQINLKAGEYSKLYGFFVNGTGDGLSMKLQSGKTSGSLKDIDTDNMPDGAAFLDGTSTHFTNVCLYSGNFVDIVFSSVGGASQDVDIYLTPLGDC